jgi:hypothetical protein
MKITNRIALTAAFLVQSTFAQSCPIPPTEVAPSVKLKITFNPKDGGYTYEYTLSNSATSKLPIERFIILNEINPQSIRPPDHWHGRFVNLPELEKNIVWSTSALDPNDPNRKRKDYVGPPLKLFYSVKPGAQLSGFELVSPNPPGPVHYFAEGETEIPRSVPTVGDDEAEPNCPGFSDEPRFKSMFGGVTEGPMPPGTVPVSIRLLRASGEWHSHQCNPDKDTGKISVLIFANRDFDPNLLTLPSVKFGPGVAPVLSSKTLPDFKDREDQWADWEKSVKRIHPDQSGLDEKERSRKKPLVLTFDLKAVGIRCGLDNALFLEGKTSDGKNIVGSVPITTRDCTPWPVKKPTGATAKTK